jgi:hypothetical protein
MVHHTSQDQTSQQYRKKLHHHNQYSNFNFAEPTFRKRHTYETDQNLRTEIKDQSRLRISRFQSSLNNAILFSEMISVNHDFKKNDEYCINN